MKKENQSLKRKRRYNKLAVTAMVCLAIAVASVLYVFVSQRGTELLRLPFLNAGAGKASSSSASGSSQVSSSSDSQSDSAASTGASSEASSSSSLLMLVNKSHSIPDGYSPDLTRIDSSYYMSSDRDNHFDVRAAQNLKDFIDGAKSAGYKVCILSGYRSHSYQVSNYNAKVSQYKKQGYTSSQAESKAAAVVAPPGTSEHETGLSADIITTNWYQNNSELTEAFDQTSAFVWLDEHAADYGFILRYPKGKESITGYTYEPWHYRYVGKANAKKIAQSGLCLEEYLEKYPVS